MTTRVAERNRAERERTSREREYLGNLASRSATKSASRTFSATLQRVTQPQKFPHTQQAPQNESVAGKAVLQAAIQASGSGKGAGRLRAGRLGDDDNANLSEASSGLTTEGGNATTLSVSSGSEVSESSSLASSDEVVSAAVEGDSSAELFAATEELQELNQSFNLQYLMLQQEMQADNRQFTSLSNIIKTKHDTAKNAISNVR